MSDPIEVIEDRVRATLTAAGVGNHSSKLMRNLISDLVYIAEGQKGPPVVDESIPEFEVHEACGLHCLFWGTDRKYLWGLSNQDEAETMARAFNRHRAEILAERSDRQPVYSDLQIATKMHSYLLKEARRNPDKGFQMGDVGWMEDLIHIVREMDKGNHITL